MLIWIWNCIKIFKVIWLQGVSMCIFVIVYPICSTIYAVCNWNFLWKISASASLDHSGVQLTLTPIRYASLHHFRSFCSFVNLHSCVLAIIFWSQPLYIYSCFSYCLYASYGFTVVFFVSCRLLGCKNWPSLYWDGTLYKAVKSGFMFYFFGF